MLYSQKRANSVVHFKMADSRSDIYVSQLQGCVFPADVSLSVYRDECICFPAAHAAMINYLQVIVIYVFQGIMYSYMFPLN